MQQRRLLFGLKGTVANVSNRGNEIYWEKRKRKLLVGHRLAGNTRLENVFIQIIKNNDLHAKLLMWQIHQHDYYYIDLHVNL